MIGFLEKLLKGREVAWKSLGEIAEIGTGNSNRQDENENGEYPFFVRSKTVLKSNTYKFDEAAIIIPGEGGVGEIFHFIDGKYALHQRAYRIHIITKNLEPKFVYYIMLNDFKNYILNRSVNATVTSIRKPMLENFKIPIPPLDVQNEIVRVLDKFTALNSELIKELDLRKKQYEYYRDKLLTFGDKVEWKTLDEIFTIFAGGDVPKNAFSKIQTKEFNIPILSNGINEKSLYGWTNEAKINQPSLTISARGTIGWTSYQEKPFFPIVRLLVLTPKIELNIKFAYHFMKLIENDYKIPKSGIPQLTKPMIKDLKFPLPSISEQQRIADILDKFETLTNSITDGLPKEIELRAKQYEYYREQLLTFG